MNLNLDIDQLKTFIAIAETGSFTKAAEHVHKTQSAVSMQMKKLEEKIGYPIFARDGRQTRVTRHGSLLQDYARRILALNSEAMAAFSGETLSGTIRFGLPDDYAPRLLPSILANFSSTHPTIEVDITSVKSSTVAEMITNGELDLGLVTQNACGVSGQLVRREPLEWVTSRTHTVHLADPIPLALGPYACTWRQDAMRLLEEAGQPYRVAFTSSSAGALSSAVFTGLAVAVLPESALLPDMRILRERDGFPRLPHCSIGMLRATKAVDPVHDALANHIIQALDNVNGRNSVLPVQGEYGFEAAE